MIIDKTKFIQIHKVLMIVFIAYYLLSVFVLKSLQPAIIIAMCVCLFNLFHENYYCGRLKMAAFSWLVPILAIALFAQNPIKSTVASACVYDVIFTLILCIIPVILLVTGKAAQKPSQRSTIPIVKIRIATQVLIFAIYALASALTWIKGGKTELFFWAGVNILTVSLLPFLVGRAMCGWICPNATLQDGLFKHLNYPRPIQLSPAIEEQSRSSAMYLSGEADKGAPYLPFSLLIAWFPIFILETVFDLTAAVWYPLCFAYALYILSLLFPWRKFCTYFCWFSSYRCLASHNSLWRIKFNQSACRSCKSCAAEKACPMHIDIRQQQGEMPATCCVCFSCMDKCPYPDVITFKKNQKCNQNQAIPKYSAIKNLG